jgi:hypothetical protein
MKRGWVTCIIIIIIIIKEWKGLVVRLMQAQLQLKVH